MTNEPKLENISDYNSLQGEKKKVVWIVILSGLLVGFIYLGAKIYYGSVSDEIKVEKIEAKSIPYK